MKTPIVEPNNNKNFKWSLFRDFLFLLTAIFESTILFVFFWRKRSNGKDIIIGESDDEVYSDEEEETFFNEEKLLKEEEGKGLLYHDEKEEGEEETSKESSHHEENVEKTNIDVDNEDDEFKSHNDRNELIDDLQSSKDESFRDIDFDKLDSFINEHQYISETSADDEKSKLLAALGDFKFGNDSDSDESDDDSSSTSSSGSYSSSNSSSSSSSDEYEEDRNLLKEFYVSEATNKTGLRRAKKKVISGNKKGHYQMEDVHFCAYPWEDNENLSLFCIFDGHSGRECADAAKEIVPKLLKEKIKDIDINDDTNLEKILKEVFKEADEKMSEFEYEGSTATVIPMWKYGNNRYFQVANIGDSSAAIVTKDGKAKQLTVDHRPSVESEKERLASMGIILNEGQNRLNGLAVSRAFGDHFPKSVECGLISDPDVTKVFKISKNHKMIILASDGLWDVVSPQIAYNIIKDLDSSQEMAETLLKTATKSKKCTDNVTVIIIIL